MRALRVIGVIMVIGFIGVKGINGFIMAIGLIGVITDHLCATLELPIIARSRRVSRSYVIARHAFDPLRLVVAKAPTRRYVGVVIVVVCGAKDKWVDWVERFFPCVWRCVHAAGPRCAGMRMLCGYFRRPRPGCARGGGAGYGV